MTPGEVKDVDLGEEVYSKRAIEALKGAAADAVAENSPVQVRHLLMRLLSKENKIPPLLGESLKALKLKVSELPERESPGTLDILSQSVESALKHAQELGETEGLNRIHSRHICQALLAGLEDQDELVRAAVESLAKSELLDPTIDLPDTCTGCGWKSSVRRAFQPGAPVKGVFHCLRCHRQDEQQRLARARWAVGFATAGAVLLIWATDGSTFSQSLKYLAYTVVALVVGVGMHELGHAIAARFLGFQIDLVRVGLGGRLASLRVFDTRFDINVLPVAGLVLVHPGRDSGKLKWVLMYLAGPATNAVVATAVYLLAVTNEVEEGFLVALFFVNIWLAVGNLIPFIDQGQGCPVPSDGLAMVQVATGREAGRARFRRAGVFFRANDFYENEQFEQARKLVVDTLKDSPQDEAFVDMYGAILIELGKISEARALYEDLMSKGENPIRLNNLAWCSFLDGKDIPKAIKFVKRALDLEPRMGFGYGTLGCLYLRESRYQEALDTLRQAIHLNKSPRSLACNACYAAVASGYLGDCDAKADYLQLVCILNPNYKLLEAARSPSPEMPLRSSTA